MKTELLTLIENYGKALVHQTEGKISAFKDAKNLMSNIVFLLDKAEQAQRAEYPPLPDPAWAAATIHTTEDAYTAAQMHAYADADRAQSALAATSAEPADALTHTELLEIRRAAEDFESHGETDVDDELLIRGALAGYLECTNFRLLNESALELDIQYAAQAAQKNGGA